LESQRKGNAGKLAITTGSVISIVAGSATLQKTPGFYEQEAPTVRSFHGFAGRRFGQGGSGGGREAKLGAAGTGKKRFAACWRLIPGGEERQQAPPAGRQPKNTFVAARKKVCWFFFMRLQDRYGNGGKCFRKGDQPPCLYARREAQGSNSATLNCRIFEQEKTPTEECRGVSCVLWDLKRPGVARRVFARRLQRKTARSGRPKSEKEDRNHERHVILTDPGGPKTHRTLFAGPSGRMDFLYVLWAGGGAGSEKNGGRGLTGADPFASRRSGERSKNVKR